MRSSGAQRFAVETHGDAGLEAHDDLDGLLLDHPREGVDVVWRRRPRVLDGTALDRLAPEVVVDGVRLLLGDGDGDLPLGRQLDAVLSAQPPDAGRGDDAEIGRQGAHTHFETHLVVPLAGAPVRHRRCPMAPRLGNEMPDDHRARQRGDERVLPLVARVGLEGRHTELLGHLVAGVDDEGLDRPGGECPRADSVPVLATAVGRLPDVDRHRHDLDALVLDEPAHGDRGIEPTAVGQHYPLRHVRPLPSRSMRSCWWRQCPPRRADAPPWCRRRRVRL